MNNTSKIATLLLLLLLAADAQRLRLARQRVLIRSGRAPLARLAPASFWTSAAIAMRQPIAFRQRNTHRRRAGASAEKMETASAAARRVQWK